LSTDKEYDSSTTKVNYHDIAFNDYQNISVSLCKSLGIFCFPKDHIIAGLWLAPAVSWRPLITAGSNQEPAMIWCYHYRFESRIDDDKIAVQKASAVLSFLLSSIPSTEARVWAALSIVAAALHLEACS